MDQFLEFLITTNLYNYIKFNDLADGSILSVNKNEAFKNIKGHNHFCLL